MKKITFIILFFLLLFWGCSSSEKAVKDKSQNNSQEIYVFDDVVNEDSLSNKNDSLTVTSTSVVQTDTSQMNTNTKAKTFIVQVGAFTTMNKAEKFVRLNQDKINWEMKISFSNSVNLYVVQLPAFLSRSKAETVRNQLWKTKTFSDAFILTK